MHRHALIGVPLSGTLMTLAITYQPIASYLKPNFDLDKNSLCEQLDRVSVLGRSVPDYITRKGVDTFTNPVMTTCPHHIGAFSAAWEKAAAAPEMADQLSVCEQLSVLENEQQGTIQDGQPITNDFFSNVSEYRAFIKPVFANCRNHLDMVEETVIAAMLPEEDISETQISGTSQEVAFSERESTFCMKLDSIKAEGRSPAIAIFEAGVDKYYSSVMLDCIEHVKDLRTAISMQTFEELDPCEQVRRIASEPDKEVADYILESGMDRYASCSELDDLLEVRETLASK